MNLKSFRNIIIIAALLLLSGGIGYRMGDRTSSGESSQVVITGSNPPNDINLVDASKVDFSLFWDVWNKLSNLYLDKSALNPQKMVYGAISGMVASLDDPYTVFLTPQENKEAKDDLGGKFEGIGAQLGMKDKRIVVVAPLSGMPAESAGLRSGDWIVKVDGEETVGWTLPKAVAQIRGPKGSTVTLTILHEEEEKPIDIPIVRDTIKVASVEWDKKNVKCQSSSVFSQDNVSKVSSSQNSGQVCQIVEDKCDDCSGLAYLKLSRFGDQTMSEWNQAIKEIVDLNCGIDNPNCRGVIFDLRNNPGGYLQESVYIASEFLPDGIVVTQSDNRGNKQEYAVNRQGRMLNSPLVVLVNQGSASASEIVAGALKVRNRAKLVGEKTFGKGSVQETQDFSDGSGLHVTVARWLLPDGSQINGEGIEPDVIIEAKGSESSLEKPRDTQLDKAVEVLIRSKN